MADTIFGPPRDFKYICLANIQHMTHFEHELREAYNDLDLLTSEWYRQSHRTYAI